MKGVVVIDAGNDRGFGFLKHLMGDGAIPEALVPMLESFVGGGPRERQGNCRMMWPEQDAFPVSDIRDLILNHIYATAQNDVPEPVVQGIKDELYPLIEGAPAISDDEAQVKSAIMRGSFKKYKTVTPDGALIEVTITSPNDLSDMSAMDALKQLTADAERKEMDDDTEKFARIDLDKAIGVFGAFFTDEKMDTLAINMAKMASLTETTVIPNTGEFKRMLDTAVDYTAAKYGMSKTALLSKIAATDDDLNKVTVGEFVIDKRKLSKRPYDSRESSKKAISDTMFRKVCDPISGNLRLEKIKAEYEKSKDHPLSERVMDNILKSLRWID
jgi:hypothetical protein